MFKEGDIVEANADCLETFQDLLSGDLTVDGVDGDFIRLKGYANVKFPASWFTGIAPPNPEMMLPCPHCGSDAVFIDSWTMMRVRCGKCDAMGGGSNVKATAIQNWNRRATANG